MIEIHDHLYALHTKETTYAFRVMETGQLEHLYYGRKIALGNGASLVEKHLLLRAIRLPMTRSILILL